MYRDINYRTRYIQEIPIPTIGILSDMSGLFYGNS